LNEQDSNQENQMETTTTPTLAEKLAGFSGSDEYTQHWSGLVYTSGIAYLAEEAQAYWLIDAIGSYQRERRIRDNKRLQEFQLWTLTVRPDGIAVLICREDSGQREVIRQKIEYTDFPIPGITLYVENGVLLLRSEH